jgi:REP element-mobilizing transposase RayT
MGNTYTQIYLHYVFAVPHRTQIIREDFREDVQRVITGIVTGLGQKLIAIYCMPDHTHLLAGLRPDIAPADVVKKVKTGATNHINRQRLIPCRFAWQEGYGAFSVSHSGLARVISYIREQPTRHRRKTFISEYRDFLNRHEVEYDERYLLREPA